MNAPEKISLPLPSVTEDPRYIGASVPRSGARRLTEGRGQYLDDMSLPRMGHVVFWRSPLAHARIISIDRAAASQMPGVLAIVDGQEMAKVCKPWVAVLGHLPGMKSAPQYPLAPERVCWQGEPVVAVVAKTRAQAEDALQLLQVELEELTPVVDMESALSPATPVIHPELGDNLCFTRDLDTGGVDDAFANADIVEEATFHFGRHTGVTLEPRAQIADWDAGQQRLTVYHSQQAPHMMQDLYSRQFDLPESAVRVICRDVGGSFGIKVHAYPDDFATVALSIMLKRPIKFVADRLESFATDIHAREHRVWGRIAATASGEILAFEIDDLTAIGPYSMFPRTSAIEGNQVVNLVGGPYKHKFYRAHLDVVFQNKTPTCQYRGVGHPIACAVTEGLVDLAARKLGIDALELRRRNVIPDDAYPCTAAAGIKLEVLSHQACLAKLESMIDYGALLKEQAELRSKGVYRGIGFATVIELTNPSAAFYGVGGARISAQDGATARLEPSGAVTVMVGVGEQGQGTEGIYAQISADAVGVGIEKVRIVTGDTDVTPYGGGTWASRGAGIGGEAVLLACQALRENILKVAAAILQREMASLTLRRDAIVDADSHEPVLPLAELGRIAYFRPDTLPAGFQSELMVTRHYAQRDYPFIFTNGIQASYVEVDVDTGFVKLLKHWVVEDCGRVLNPMLVDEQMRGAIVQGIGGALYEECLYDGNGIMQNGSMADYLVPMAAEMPDIEVAHVETPTASSKLGAKGAGEAGTAGAPAAVVNAINDALAPFKAACWSQPVTPEKILRALGRV
ncbi:xanthine dehydrogenase family protein molybdopterin-binding subunit [Lacisediminimonas sp.]|uniref:xanthine dehydrogenase family protein molybdopterin-binding subunit n=1 Tax=Lacisediminimonas sp. TaxID=3060582 RepID=UPI00271DF988|nr:xanthine dehydrogenase family protein molybdopterin-binding subunit [Lacisediminimonas sp.]MDO8299242.1 xanthine dehydrogenase family protein molybdopterin-binding subunit [Lacisediminimonas sp.]